MLTRHERGTGESLDRAVGPAGVHDGLDGAAKLPRMQEVGRADVADAGRLDGVRGNAAGGELPEEMTSFSSGVDAVDVLGRVRFGEAEPLRAWRAPLTWRPTGPSSTGCSSTCR